MRNKGLSENNLELKDSLGLKDDFFKIRHGEKKELILLRQKLILELITIRDSVAIKRHKERIELINNKFNLYTEKD